MVSEECLDTEGASVIPGTTITILPRMLGYGGTAVVYDGYDAHYQQHCAVKVSRTANDVAQLKHEAQIYRHLGMRTMGVPGMIWSGKIEDKHAIVLSRSTGQQPLTSFAPMASMETFRAVGIKLLACLREIHYKRVVHGDIKPPNILVFEPRSGRVQVSLIDFGYAVLMNKQYLRQAAEASSYSIARNVRGGTCIFASINWQRNTSISYRDDLESLVYTLYFLKCGALPWCVAHKGRVQALDTDHMLECKLQMCQWIKASGAPPQLASLWQYARDLQVDEEPDYDYIIHTIFQDF
ncbi:hypothetical protein NM688_g6465 [Phlebia brevispora]|uniref:Uncharacterized protein n=1 Tax=Phlebia brevispora TaxID=194682 RepID=A0ACC1SFT5_9APHY|nr:hypothetical protein NM688_g6465 [Phlebia brevispora]